jgi:hypothetical protein
MLIEEDDVRGFALLSGRKGIRQPELSLLKSTFELRQR